MLVVRGQTAHPWWVHLGLRSSDTFSFDAQTEYISLTTSFTSVLQ